MLMFNLNKDNEPDIYNAIRGALLENVQFKNGTNIPDYTMVQTQYSRELPNSFY